MKTLLNLKCAALIVILISINSCSQFETTCENIEKTHVSFLIDISDKDLYSEISDDLKNNLSQFMRNNNLGHVDECQQFEFSIGHLSAVDELFLKSAKIGISKKGLSGIERKKQSNPSPILKLIADSLKDYELKSNNTRYNRSSSILSTVVKSILHFNTPADNTVFIFSDMIENNGNVNFYRSIPQKETEIKILIKKLVDPILLGKLKNSTDGFDVKIVIVLKKGKNVDYNQIKVFWDKCFELLGFSNVVFIDNLTNQI